MYQLSNKLSKDNFTGIRIVSKYIDISKKSALAKQCSQFLISCYRVCQDRGLRGAK